MNSKDYQKWAITKDRTTQQYVDLNSRLSDIGKLRLIHSIMGLSGEVGELTDAIKKHVMYNKELDIKNVKEECGDLLWYLSLMLNEIGSSFEEVMKMNHDKLEKRYPEGFTEKLAQERRDKVEILFTRENARCPKCLGTNLMVERRPNGNAKCIMGNCTWSGPYKDCFER